MKIAWPGEKLAIKIIETLERSVGGFLEPWQIRRTEAARTDARINELLALEQAKRYAKSIRTGELIFKDNRLVEAKNTDGHQEPTILPAKRSPKNAGAQFLVAHERDVVAQDLERSINLRKIAIYAEEEAERIGDQTVSEEPVDPDWFARWRTNAQDVSREEMQRLWARVLAGEAAKPGSFSIHSLEFLARMSKKDADLIAKIAPYVINNKGIFKDGNQILTAADITLGDLIYLEDLGILNGVVGIGGLTLSLNTISILPEDLLIIQAQGTTMVLFRPNAGSKPLPLPVYSLSLMGSEIVSLAKFSSNHEYLKEIAQFAGKNGFTHVLMNGDLNLPKCEISAL